MVNEFLIWKSPKNSVPAPPEKRLNYEIVIDLNRLSSDDNV